MPSIRISAETYKRLVNMKRGNNSIDDVIVRLIMLYVARDLNEEVKDFERKAVEAKGEKSSPGPGG